MNEWEKTQKKHRNLASPLETLLFLQNERNLSGIKMQEWAQFERNMSEWPKCLITWLQGQLVELKYEGKDYVVDNVS